MSFGMYQVKFTIRRSDEPDFSDTLLGDGADSVSVQDGHDDELLVSAIFRDLKTLREDISRRATEIVELHEQVWKYRWLEHLEGTAVTDQVYIQPTTSAAMLPREYPYVIRIDPRDAFGDGHHPTTALCVRALTALLAGRTAEERARLRLIDVGTGTGVLAVLAALLGIGRVDAIDIDEESVGRARENFARNDCARINARHASVADFATDAQYDIVIANLLTGIITDNIDHLLRLAAPGGTIIFSGISAQWHDEMRSFFRAQGLVMRKHLRKDGWNGYIVETGKRL